MQGDIRCRWVFPIGTGPHDGADWHLKKRDKFYVADVDGDGTNEIIVVSPNSQWVGILEDQQIIIK